MGKQPPLILAGFPLDPQASDSENASLLADVARSMGADPPRMLGRTAFAAYLTEQGTIRELAGKKRESCGAKYADAAMDSHGRILTIEAGTYLTVSAVGCPGPIADRCRPHYRHTRSPALRQSGGAPRGNLPAHSPRLS